MSLILVLILILGGGVAAAAEQSLPGDALYSFKTNVNEQIMALLAISPEAEARWQARVIERRLEEAEELVREGELTAELAEDIKNDVEDGVARIEEQMVILREEGKYQEATDVSAEFEASLAAHSEILIGLVDLVGQENLFASDTVTDGGVDGEVGAGDAQSEDASASLSYLHSIVLTVDLALADATARREDAEVRFMASIDKENERAIARERMDEAGRRINNARAALEEFRAERGSDNGYEAEARLLAADNELDRGGTSVGDEDFQTSFTRFQFAIRAALEAEAFLRAEGVAAGDALPGIEAVQSSIPLDALEDESSASLEDTMSEDTPMNGDGGLVEQEAGSDTPLKAASLLNETIEADAEQETKAKARIEEGAGMSDGF